MVSLKFEFYKILKEIDINVNLRVSTWMDENNEYLMPCEFKNVLKKNSTSYIIKINALDPNRFISKKNINKKFYFGHPGKIIGYGILKQVDLTATL